MKKLLTTCLAVFLIVGCSDPEPQPDMDGDGVVVDDDGSARPDGPESDAPSAPDPVPDGWEVTKWGDGTEFGDGAIGLAEGTLFDTVTPMSYEANPTDPGDREPMHRAFSTSPPRIPHGVGDMDPITMDENLCLECHNGEDGRATPESHYTKMDMKSPLIGMRYNCTVCHVPQTNAKPLVDNPFRD